MIDLSVTILFVPAKPPTSKRDDPAVAVTSAHLAEESLIENFLVVVGHILHLPVQRDVEVIQLAVVDHEHHLILLRRETRRY